MLNIFRATATYLVKNPFVRAILQIAVVLSAIVLSISFFGPTEFQVQGLSLKAYVKPSLDGHSYLKLPPLGDLSADTHRGPVDFFVELTEIHPDIIDEGFSIVNSQEEWIGNIQSEAKSNVTLFLLKQVLIGAAGAAIVYWVIVRPNWRKLTAVLVGSFVLVALVFGYSLKTFNMEAFRQPHYKGVVAAGPEIMQLSNKLYDRFMNFREKTDEVVSSINTLFSNIDGLSILTTPDNDEVQILVVSDISNNPIGIQLAETLANNFDVDFIIDAGDLTDFGTPLETQSFGSIGKLKVPYLFAPGNHDSPEVLEFLRQFPNVKVLEGSVVSINGLSVLGVPDPWAYGSTVTGASEAENQLLLEQQAQTLKAKLEENPDIDIAVIHNPSLAESLEGLAPVIISGHTHKVSVKKSGNSFFLNPGTTGASGFRGLQAQDMSYTALIVHLTPTSMEHIVVDVIEYDPLSSSISAERRLLELWEQERRTEDENYGFNWRNELGINQ